MKANQDLTNEQNVAREAAATAAGMIRSRMRNFGKVSHKIGTDIVTDIDFAAERLIIDKLKSAFAEDAILSEEAGMVSDGHRRRWVVDPLDGTVNFASGIDYYAIAIGLEDSEGPLLGLIHDPSREQVFSAVAGAPTFCNGTPCPGPSATAIGNAVIALQLPEPLWRSQQGLVALTQTARGVRVSGSVALDLCWLAAGHFDLMLYRRTPSRWDWLAGEMIAAQAPNIVVRPISLLGEFELMVAGRAELVDICYAATR